MTTPTGPLVKRRQLGRSGVEVTPLILGGAALGGLFSPVNDGTAQSVLEAAWGLGMRAFDTAPHYGVGLSESRMGKFLATKPRDDFVLSTKVGRLLFPTDVDVDGAEGFFGTPQLARVRDYSRHGVLASLAASRERLGFDRIDVALVHDPDDHYLQAAAEALPTLIELRHQGEIGAVGVGMNQTAMLERFVEDFDIDCVMVAGRWSLLDYSASGLLERCARRGVSVLVAGVFNSGLLVNPVPGATFDYRQAPPELVNKAALMASACQQQGVPLAAAALQYPFRHPAVTAVLVGARTAEEVRDDVAFMNLELPVQLYRELALLAQ